MQLVLMASGTRGDVQPVIALGKALKLEGHQVKVVAGSNFIEWVQSHGLDVYPTVNIEALMQSELGVKWVESTNGLDQLKYMKALMSSISEQTITDTVTATQGADLLIGGFVSEPYLQAVHEKFGTPLISIGLQPYRASKNGAANIMPIIPGTSSILNRWMGQITERITWSVARETTAILRQHLGLPNHTATSYLRAVHQIPLLYAMSPSVVPPVEDANAYTTGYWFLDEDYAPPQDLIQFIEAEEPPIYVGFGSMSSSDPARTIAFVAEALQQVGRRGILAKGWSGGAVQHIPDHLYLLDKTSHTWLFPRMAAVVHHGGAGTTAAGLRAGKPTLIIPHMADQPYWGRRVHEMGVGTKPIPRHKLTVENLTASLKTLLTDSRMQTKAAALGECIEAEHGVETAVEWIKRYANA